MNDTTIFFADPTFAEELTISYALGRSVLSSRP